MVLMCKNAAVYNVKRDEVINKNLLPGYMLRHGANNGTFKSWLKKRYSSGTNTLARQLRGITFGQGNRLEIDRTTRALSLSDCYWLKDENDKNDDITFERISPYYNSFWKGEGEYESGSIPTLYVPGYVSKAWLNSEYLYKSGCEIETECSNLCLKVGISCAEVKEYNGGIIVKNITDTKYMLEQADMTGIFDDENYTDEDIIREFGLDGYKMILTDAIFGNGDRHLGNFGYMRDADNGKYIRMAPLYDFDHALDAKESNDILIKNAVRFAQNNTEFNIAAKAVLNAVSGTDCNSIFKMRAEKIRENIDI